MLRIFRRFLTNIPRAVNNCTPPPDVSVQSSRCFGMVSASRSFDSCTVSLLKPNLLSLMPSCGLKYKGKPKLRCKDCYKVLIDGRLHIKCHTFGRHKQAQLVKKPKNTWVLAHATQGKCREW